MVAASCSQSVRRIARASTSSHHRPVCRDPSPRPLIAPSVAGVRGGRQFRHHRPATRSLTSMGRPGSSASTRTTTAAQNDELDRIGIKQVFTHGPFPQKTVGRLPVPDQAQHAAFRRRPVPNGLPEPDQEGEGQRHRGRLLQGRLERARGHERGIPRAHPLLLLRGGQPDQVIGRVRGLEEVYKHTLNASNTYDLGSEGAAGECRRNYHGL